MYSSAKASTVYIRSIHGFLIVRFAYDCVLKVGLCKVTRWSNDCHR